MNNRRLLVIDDESINLNVIKTILMAEGHEVVALSSGLEALKLCRAGDCAFDMVLLDVHMPILNGFETALAMRGIKGMEDTPVIFVSARATQADQEAGLAAGGRHYLTKPFKRKALLDAVAQFLPNRPGPLAS